MNKEIRLSVHQLVDFLLRKGDIDERVFNRSSMNEGSAIHALYQAKQGDNYLSEYPLKTSLCINDFSIVLEGRADGIIKKPANEYVIDEIKTTVIELERFKEENLDWHLGQAKCYAYMFAKEQKLDTIGVKLTYIRQGNVKEKMFVEYTFFYSELDQYVHSLLENYFLFYNIIENNILKRNETIKTLNFPFPSFRKGQRELAKYAYSLCKNGGVLFCEAPTGIGKTMSTIFPYVKALNDDEQSKIFYLTAKTSGKDSAHQAFNILSNSGLTIKTIIITAKDKICFCKDKGCNPDECPFTKNYYNKIKGVLNFALLNIDDFTPSVIENLALENQMCPFELSLDLSLFCDVIICDYNYMFDPLSYMKRYFDEDSSHHLALIDEAHNLVERSRKMYSAFLSKKTLLLAKKSYMHSKDIKIKNSFKKLNEIFNNMEDIYPYGETKIEDLSSDTYKILNKFCDSYQTISKTDNNKITKEYLDLYLEINRFLKISEYMSERFVCFVERNRDDIKIHITCLDASRFIKRNIQQIKAATFFSATLSPANYFIDMLGGEKGKDPLLKLSSPFSKEKLKIIIAPKVSTRYKNRDQSYQQVADYVSSFIKNKKGNYLVYLPSYEYLEKLSPFLKFKKSVKTIFQTQDMKDIEKEAFLDNFALKPKKTTVGFAIIGGSFGEGVDLVSDRLIGVVVVGVGLSKLNFVSNQISEYYAKNGFDGYQYAYLYPGMNKVAQAVGRVIRSENDRGAVLLIDERYMTNDYQETFKSEWANYEVALTKEEVSEITKDFFGD